MFFLLFILKKIRLDISYKSSAKKNQTRDSWATAHLSETATADMQMLCNIFPILSLQLLKGSSFEQFLVLKKNNVFYLSLFYNFSYFCVY